MRTHESLNSKSQGLPGDTRGTSSDAVGCVRNQSLQASPETPSPHGHLHTITNGNRHMLAHRPTSAREVIP